MENWLKGAHKQIVQNMFVVGENRGPGTTGIVLKILPSGEVAWASIGDSRPYLIRGGQAEQLSTDDGYMNVVSHSIGGARDWAPPNTHNLQSFQAQSGDRLVLVSDGITSDYGPDVVEEEKLVQGCEGKSAQGAADNLIRGVARKIDDRSVLVIDIP